MADLAAIQQKIIAFRNERDWAQFHDPKNLAEALSIEAGELLENFLWKTTEQSRKLSTCITGIWYEKRQFEYVESMLRLARNELRYKGVLSCEDNQRILKQPIERKKPTFLQLIKVVFS